MSETQPSWPDHVEPYEHGLLPRPDGSELYWETSGNPMGRAALYLHGGPGSGLGDGGYRRRFDPAKYRIVGLDQRGCGRSTPLASESLDTLDANNTQTLIADLEALREHLGIDEWLIHGVSWGCTLALAYALGHPARASSLVLTAVTSGSREEIDWITEGVGSLFPEAWERFRAPALDDERVVQVYARLLRDPDAAIRAEAARAWNEWESTHISLDPSWTPGPRFVDEGEGLNFATLVTHYWANDCFLSGSDRIRDRIAKLAEVPGVLIHGRRDISSPAITPWTLHRAWPNSKLIIVEDEGHGGEQEMQLTARAISAFGDVGSPGSE